MCTQHPIEEHCKLDPPWEGPQVIPAQLRRVDNLIFRRLNQFSRANGVEQTTPMHGWIIEYLYRHRDEPVFQRDIEREFSITRSTVTNILQLMERKGYIQRLSVPQDARLKQLVLTKEGHPTARKDPAFLPPDRRLCGRTADRGGERRTAAAAEQAAGSTEITIFSVKAPKKDLLN